MDAAFARGAFIALESHVLICFERFLEADFSATLAQHDLNVGPTNAPAGANIGPTWGQDWCDVVHMGPACEDFRNMNMAHKQI